MLLAARGDDLEALCRTAARVRDAGLEAAGRPGVVTYSPKGCSSRSPGLCRDRCHYCTFVTTPNQRLAAAGAVPTCPPTRSWRSPGRAPPSAAGAVPHRSATGRGPLAGGGAGGSPRHGF